MTLPDGWELVDASRAAALEKELWRAEMGYAVVHLTWIGRRERSAQWPRTKIYTSLVDLPSRE